MDFETKEIIETVLTILGTVFKIAFVVGGIYTFCHFNS